jgi:hypothetical protein
VLAADSKREGVATDIQAPQLTPSAVKIACFHPFTDKHPAANLTAEGQRAPGFGSPTGE